MKKTASIAIVLLVLIASIMHTYSKALSPVDASDVRTVFTIPKGSSTAKIADDLAKQNLIRLPFAFTLYVKQNGVAGKLKAGSFVLQSSMSTAEIVDAIAGGKQAEEIITIPEGFTVADIDALMAKKGIVESGKLIDCAKTCDFSSFTFLPKTVPAAPGGKIEGYLFPDTYYVTVGDFVPKFFLERLLTTFKHRVIEDLASDLKGSKRPLPDIIAMASLIEAETRNADERPIIAGILWKRFDQKMGLGVDASVRYGLGKFTEPLTESDLASKSPYNLRKYRGLPPTPIASPSINSIRAALHPKDSSYFYYLHDTGGVIHYAVTNNEQNVNKAKYLQ